jgi:hypothetical protein
MGAGYVRSDCLFGREGRKRRASAPGPDAGISTKDDFEKH